MREAGAKQQTPDLSAILDEIVSRPDWQPGNSLVIIITGNGERVAESYDGDQAGAPLLHVEFTSPVPTSSPASSRSSPEIVEPFSEGTAAGAAWTNSANPPDVDDSGVITPIDALLVINELNSPRWSVGESGRLPETADSSASGFAYLDVSGDGIVSPLDALLVINYLNAMPSSAALAVKGLAGFSAVTVSALGEGEGIPGATTVQTSFPFDIASEAKTSARPAGTRFENGAGPVVTLRTGPDVVYPARQAFAELYQEFGEPDDLSPEDFSEEISLLEVEPVLDAIAADLTQRK
jgi:hypothetical protein